MHSRSCPLGFKCPGLKDSFSEIMV
jgi:hypothetical protein